MTPTSVRAPSRHVYVIVPIILAVTFLTQSSSLAVAVAQPLAPTPVGIAPAGFNSIEFLGQLERTGNELRGFGYLTHINGLDHDLMFAEADAFSRSERNACFTYYLIARHQAGTLGELFITDAVGSLLIFLAQPGGADFAEPRSFAGGVLIATATLRLHDIHSAQAPDKLFLTGVGESTQITATPFYIRGKSYVLGIPRDRLRVTYAGDETLTRDGSLAILAGQASS
jgi:hypothetical protein